MKKALFFIEIICMVVIVLFSADYIGNIMTTVEKRVNIDKAEDCDIAFIGSSHVYRGINPQMIYDKTGITSVNIATSSQDIKGSYWLLNAYLKKHHPQVVFVEVPTWFAGARETYALWNFHDYDLNKCRTYLDLKNERFDFNDASRFLAFRTEYSSIDKKDFDYLRGDGHLKSDRWYNAIYSGTHEIDAKEISDRYDESDEIDKNSIISYVDKAIQLASKHNVKIVFIHPPEVTCKQQDEFYEELYDYLTTRDVDFRDYADIRSGNSEFDVKRDFADLEHLSYAGGTKFTSLLCDYTTNDLGIVHDNSKKIDESWDRNRMHYQYTYDLLNMNKDDAETILSYSYELPSDYVVLLSFDVDAYNSMSDETKSIIKDYGIQVEQSGYAHYSVLKRGDALTISQDNDDAEIYTNIDGVAVSIRENNDGSVIQAGAAKIKKDAGDINLAIYVISYDDIILRLAE